MNVLKSSSGPQKGVDRLIESSRCAPVLFGRYLGVQSARIEQHRSFFESDGALTAWDARERVEPFEVDAETAIRWKETPLDEIQLIVVAQQQSNAGRISSRCAGSLKIQKTMFCFFVSQNQYLQKTFYLSRFHKIHDCLFVMVCIFAVVFEDEVLKQ